MASEREDPAKQPASGEAEELGEVTRFLGALSADGASGAEVSERLLEMVYKELHSQAELALSKERIDHTLQPTALVNEAWMRLADQDGVAWQNRGHFLGVASLAMRRVLVDHARSRQRDKRGGGAQREELRTEFPDAGELQADVDILTLHEGLEALAEQSERAAKVCELRFFCGLTEEETAQTLGVTRPTVTRDWRAARAWLSAWMNER